MPVCPTHSFRSSFLIVVTLLVGIIVVWLLLEQLTSNTPSASSHDLGVTGNQNNRNNGKLRQRQWRPWMLHIEDSVQTKQQQTKNNLHKANVFNKRLQQQQIRKQAVWGLEHHLTVRNAFDYTAYMLAKVTPNHHVNAIANITAADIPPLTTPETVLAQSFLWNWKPCLLAQQLVQSSNNHRLDGDTTNTNNMFRVTIVGGSLSSWCPNSCQRYSDILQDQLRQDARQFPKPQFPKPQLSNKRQKQKQKKIVDDDDNDNDNNDISHDEPFLLGHQLEVINMAQGGSTSVVNGFLLDQYLEPQQFAPAVGGGVHILVWEFSVNDRINPFNKAELAISVQEQISIETMRLKFWLHRVESFFWGRELPPVILLYPWDYGVGVAATRLLLEQGLGSTTFRHHYRVIEEYKHRPGWNLQVIHVGAGVNTTAFLKNRSALVADLHHPSCYGTQLLADALQYAIYANLATSCPTTTNNGTAIAETTTDESEQKFPVLAPINGTETEKPATTIPLRNGRVGLHGLLLANSLIDRVRVGSFSRWVPRLTTNSSSNLHATITMVNSSTSTTNDEYHNNNMEPPLELLFPDKISVTRKDRKLSFPIPACNNATWMELRFQEPDLVWIGLALTIPPTVPLVVTLNKKHPVKPLTLPPTSKDNWIVLDTFQSWIFLPEALPGATRSSPLGDVTLQLCCQQQIGAAPKPAYLHHMVGIMTNDNNPV